MSKPNREAISPYCIDIPFKLYLSIKSIEPNNIKGMKVCKSRGGTEFTVISRLSELEILVRDSKGFHSIFNVNELSIKTAVYFKEDIEKQAIFKKQLDLFEDVNLNE